MTDPFDFTQKSDKYAVMGNPIDHSKSPFIHTKFAQQTKQKIDYSAILVEHGSLPQAIGNFFAAGGKGLNITVPFKQIAWNFVDSLSERAKLAGAVNTLFLENDKIVGDNTDGVGLIRDLLQNQQQPLKNKQILILGAGGAARGILGPLLYEKPQHIVISNRNPEKAVELANSHKKLGSVDGIGFPQVGQPFDVIINATAASLSGELPPLTEEIISSKTFCYDLMYGPQPTVFLEWCLHHGALKSVDGLGMLVEQAAESFFLWRGVRPNTQSIIEQLREHISE